MPCNLTNTIARVFGTNKYTCETIPHCYHLPIIMFHQNLQSLLLMECYIKDCGLY